MSMQSLHSDNNITPADQALVSAYLDGDLSATERQQFEQRLANEPALQRELDELRQVHMLLRELPTVTPPRSFTLDPAQVAPRRNWFAALFGLPGALGALAVVLLVVLVGVSISPAAAPQQQETAVFEQVESAPPADTAPAPAAAPAPAPAAAPTLMIGGEMGDVAGETGSEVFEEIGGATADNDAATVEFADEASDAGAGILAEADEASEEAPTLAGDAPERTAPADGLTAARAAPTAAGDAAAQATPANPTAPGVLPFVQVALGATALLLLAAAVWLLRRPSH